MHPDEKPPKPEVPIETVKQLFSAMKQVHDGYKECGLGAIEDIRKKGPAWLASAIVEGLNGFSERETLEELASVTAAFMTSGDMPIVIVSPDQKLIVKAVLQLAVDFAILDEGGFLSSIRELAKQHHEEEPK